MNFSCCKNKLCGLKNFVLKYSNNFVSLMFFDILLNQGSNLNQFLQLKVTFRYFRAPSVSKCIILMENM